ncbi:hypothetical protein SAY87_030750 [Trapa incisa]|uniref:Protein IQ-DOMAIN 1 n=1 Tax=Trapa incisa TaxID=236973 RepID=A0AAN7KJE2_9MYRT|nr:hypothetical protein SAY87_030750 [Trapa incisa]
MGLTGGLVKSVFSRSRSGARDGCYVSSLSARKRSTEKRKWTSVRSYLCGEEMELDSVVAEEDSASVKSCEATIMVRDLDAEQSSKDAPVMTEQVPPQQKRNSMTKMLNEEDAAVIIQSAFRKYLATRLDEPTGSTNAERDEDPSAGMGSPRKADSISTSIEVKTGISMDVLSVRDERLPPVMSSNRTQHKARITQVLKPKEDWDDSTVSSSISRRRIQHRLEALTRRERALAYAFSQQLRVCSKKRQMKAWEGNEPDMGWSWLERWMATRESSIATDHGNQKSLVRRRLLDLAREEKESCGSNEVSVHLDYALTTAAKDINGLTPSTNGIKSTRNTTKSGSLSYRQHNARRCMHR